MFSVSRPGALVVLLGLVVSACGGDGKGGVGDGGVGGARDSGSCNVPACLAGAYALIQSCQGSGTCTTQTSSTTVATCWSNGVKFFDDLATDTVRQTHPDGTPCFSAMFTPSATVPEGFDVTFKDASGATIATGTQNRGGMVLTCDGQSFTYGCGSGAGGTGGAMTCEMGSCQ
jgi:hypothetical protein